MMMKTKVITTILTSLLLLGVWGCNESEEEKENGVKCSFSYSGCKASSNNEGRGQEEGETALVNDSIVYQIENGFLIFTHKNASFCCDQDEIIGETIIEGDSIILSEKELNPKANCICSFDLTFSISGLQNGKYHVIVKRDDMEMKNVDITVNL